MTALQSQVTLQKAYVGTLRRKRTAAIEKQKDAHVVIEQTRQAVIHNSLRKRIVFQTVLQQIKTAVKYKKDKKINSRQQRIQSLIEKIKKSVLSTLKLMKEKTIERISIAEFGEYGYPFYIPSNSEVTWRRRKSNPEDRIDSEGLIKCCDNDVRSWTLLKNIDKRKLDGGFGEPDTIFFIYDIPENKILQGEALKLFNWLKIQGLNPRIEAIVYHMYAGGVTLRLVEITIGIPKK